MILPAVVKYFALITGSAPSASALRTSTASAQRPSSTRASSRRCRASLACRPCPVRVLVMASGAVGDGVGSALAPGRGPGTTIPDWTPTADANGRGLQLSSEDRGALAGSGDGVGRVATGAGRLTGGGSAVIGAGRATGLGLGRGSWASTLSVFSAMVEL